MSFDPDAYLAEDHSQAFDPDQHLLTPDQSDQSEPPAPEYKQPTGIRGALLFSPIGSPIDKFEYAKDYYKKIGNSVKNLWETFRKDPQKAVIQSLEGAPAAIASPVAHVLGSGEAVLENAVRKLPGLPSSTYADINNRNQAAISQEVDPRSDIGKAYSGILGATFKPMSDASNLPGNAVRDTASALGVSPENAQSAGEQTNAVINNALLGYGIKKSLEAPKLPPEVQTVQDALNKNFSDKSAGAASTAPDISKTPPEFQQNIKENLSKGLAPNPEALSRQVRAQSLPVPIQLTEGQAMGDPIRISEEMNNRGKFPQYANRFQEQNRALVENMDVIREQAGPQVFSTNPTEHGDTLIKAYQDKAAIADANISAKYKALEDANGGSFPVDGQKLAQMADAALKKKLKTGYVPAQIESDLNRFRSGEPMSFEEYENLRSNLAEEARSAQNGNVRQAASIIREQMEKLPLTGGAESLKPLADAARSAAREQFAALDADPAYKAVVDGRVTPDQFVHKYIISAPRDALETMQKNLADNPVAQQTMGVAIVDHLKSAAGIDRQGNGNFSQAGFNKNFEKLEPKLKFALDPKTAQIMQDLGDAARDIQFQPKGSFVNNSNTFTTELAEAAKNTAEGVANVSFAGVPVGTWMRKVASKISEGRKIQKSLEPAAGVFAPKKMSEILKTPKKPSK